MFIAQVIVIQTALVHSELHIFFALRFLVDYEHLVLAITGDPILLYDIAQINNVGDGSLAEPIFFVLAHHFFLVGHYHGTTVYIESHTTVVL